MDADKSFGISGFLGSFGIKEVSIEELKMKRRGSYR
jgi:hypothetical protein